jgi:DeoR/GlpR family transcriptional regulator of sugar metabolism
MIDNKFLTVATNSVPAANAVLNRKGLKLLMVGGAVEADLAECVEPMLFSPCRK